MARLIKCFKCKELFLPTELTSYAAPYAKVMHNYCAKCLIEKQQNDLFRIKVASIFGDNADWSAISKQRTNLITKYGYTDTVIADCLDYLYRIKKKKIERYDLIGVNVYSINEMKKYKRSQLMSVGTITAAAKTQIKEYNVSTEENKVKPKDTWNLDDWLEEE